MIRGLALAALLAAATSVARAGPGLEQAFARPPDSAKPWAYWWWLDSHASKEGITRDLEEMQRQGIQGVLVFDAGVGGPAAPDGPAFMSPPWRELFKHAAREAARLGLEVSINLCSGWNAGGTWVRPEHAAKKLVWSRAAVRGPAEVAKALPQPKAAHGYYRDVAVLAWPTAEPRAEAKLTASSSYPKYGPELAVDRDPATRWISNGDRPGQGPRPGRPEHLQWTFAEPFPAGVLHVVPYSDCGPRDCELQASADGKTYRTVRRFRVDQRKPTTIVFAQTRSRFFRLVATSAYPYRGQESWNVQISEVMLLRKGQTPAAAVAQCLSADVGDLTGKMDAAGRLTWQAPEGNWAILRLGYTVLGARTKCTSPGAQGYEIDPLSREAMDLHFAATAGKLIADVGALAGKTLKYTHIDSWEIRGDPNWSPGLRAQFRRRRGYDPLPYLPALAGAVVDSSRITRRFLWDFRKTISECIAANYYGRLRELSQRHGMGIHPESAGPCTPVKACIDALQILGISDVPMAEFWARRGEPNGRVAWGDAWVKQAACAAHIYGKRIVQAEAYTTMGPNWEKAPSMLKDIGDHAFCRGLNRAMLCFYVHQPRLDVEPGHQWEAAGTHFDRNITWWNQIHAWLRYHSRCQFLLQQGLFVADVCYFYGEEVPNFVPAPGQMSPRLPAGYDYDVCNAEVLLERMSVRDGRLALPDGMSYRLLVLPRHRAMSPKVLRKIKELAEGGATVLGPKPERAPGLADYPRCDREVRRLADELWGAVDGKAAKGRRVGKGRIIWDTALRDTLRAAGIPPDFEYSCERKDAKLDYIHRTSDGAEIYFVPNKLNRPERATCTFRASGKLPEIWDPVTGERWDATEFRQEGGRTAVPMRFAPRQSFFVIFRKPFRGNRKERDNFPTVATAAELSGPWTVRFDPKWGGPGRVAFGKLEDWTKRPEAGIRYYSGTATYHRSFDLPEALGRSTKRLFLDLGVVKNVAEVRLNGKDLGVVWTAPWTVEITHAVRPTANRLEIDVVNLWPNRLIGDAGLPPEKRFTVTNVRKFKKNSPLLPSGLLGPVTLRTAEKLSVGPHNPGAATPPPAPPRRAARALDPT